MSTIRHSPSHTGIVELLLLLVFTATVVIAAPSPPAAVPPPPKISTGPSANTTAISPLPSLGARLAAATDDRAIAAKASLRAALPPTRFAPTVDLAQLPTTGPVPPALTTPPRPPPSPEQRAKLQKRKKHLAAGKNGKHANASTAVPAAPANHSAARAFAGAAFEIGPGAPAYVVLPGSYWVRFSNGFYMCAFNDGTIRQTPRMYGWERITVLPGPEEGRSYLYTIFHNKYIVDKVLLYDSPAVQSSETFMFSAFYGISDSSIRIEGAPVNGPLRAVGSFPYRVVSRRSLPRSVDNGASYYFEIFSTYLRAPTTGEYEGFLFREGEGTVPAPEIDFLSVRSLAPGEFWVRTYHGQFMSVHQDHVEAGTNQQAWERIRVIKADEEVYGRNRYHLWNDWHQRYLTFDHNGLALSTVTQSWETFRIVSHPKHYESFSIFSDFHGKFLRQACAGCGFDATLSNTDAQSGDVTAFTFLPIEWFSHTPFYNTNLQLKPFRFDATGKFLKLNIGGTPSATQQNEPSGVATIRFFGFAGDTGQYFIAFQNAAAEWFLLDNALALVALTAVQQTNLVFHDILAHPKIPNRYVIRLCYSCSPAVYLAAHPDGSIVTTSQDAASDYTAFDIIF